MSLTLTDEQIDLIYKAKTRMAVYYNDKGEFTVKCNDCAIRLVNDLLKVIDDLEFELDQLNK
jgi:hypothetical protein